MVFTGVNGVGLFLQSEIDCVSQHNIKHFNILPSIHPSEIANSYLDVSR